jgi:HD-GYP domain-containing protein (c-di-GMP phosphodiesterase class II)
LSLTLLVENNPKIESFYMLNLSTWLGLEVVTKKKAEFALKFLETDAQNIKLIIVRSVIEKADSARAIMEHLLKRGLEIPVIVIGPGKEIPGCFAFVPNSLHLKILIQGAARALNITAKDMSAKVVPEFFPIPINYFKDIKRSVCPVYSQNIDNADQYTQRIEKLTDFDESIINSMVQEGVTHLYVKKLDRLAFVNNVTNELITTLEGKDLSVDEEMTAADKSIELLSKKLLSIGINDETIKLANKNLEVMRRTARNNPKISKLLERLISNKTSYLFKHTQILSYICLHIVKNIDWGNPEQEDKVSFIAFFHDIVLETDEQAKIKSSLELKKANFEPAEKAFVEKHAQLAAEFVTKFPHAPMGADQIIRQHHGTLNGVGFSEHYGNNVSPVAVVFIVAEEFTRIILERETGPFDRAEMLRELKEEFPTSRFQKVIEILQSITF